MLTPPVVLADDPLRRAALALRRHQELEQARRLGRWETDEDRRLLLEHDARQLLNRAGRGLALGLVVSAWLVPPLWPVALLGSLRAFPRTTRRLLLALLASGALGLATLALLVTQLARPALPPVPAPPALAPSATDPPALRSPG